MKGKHIVLQASIIEIIDCGLVFMSRDPLEKVHRAEYT